MSNFQLLSCSLRIILFHFYLCLPSFLLPSSSFPSSSFPLPSPPFSLFFPPPSRLLRRHMSLSLRHPYPLELPTNHPPLLPSFRYSFTHLVFLFLDLLFHSLVTSSFPSPFFPYLTSIQPSISPPSIPPSVLRSPPPPE